VVGVVYRLLCGLYFVSVWVVVASLCPILLSCMPSSRVVFFLFVRYCLSVALSLLCMVIGVVGFIWGLWIRII